MKPNWTKHRELHKKLDIFYQRMFEEFEKNQNKPSILEYRTYDNWIKELEYHKSKMMLAIQQGNMQAANEYIADTANILFGLGNNLKLYEDDFKSCNKKFQFVTKKPMFKKIKVGKSKKPFNLDNPHSSF